MHDLLQVIRVLPLLALLLSAPALAQTGRLRFVGAQSTGAVQCNNCSPPLTLDGGAGLPAHAENFNSGVTTNAFSTSSNVLCAACLSIFATVSEATASVSGAGLTWTRAANGASSGSLSISMIYLAYSTAALSSVTVTESHTGAHDTALSVQCFQGAQKGYGGSTATGGATTAATISLTSTQAGSFLLSCGNSGGQVSPPPTYAAGQTVDTSWVGGSNGGEFWLTRYSTQPAAGTYSLGITAPNAAQYWSGAAVEVCAGGCANSIP
jgi:hypothetical protein